MTESEDSFAAIVRRLGWWIGALGLSGGIGAALQWGWRDGAGFAFGAFAAFLNMRWLARGLSKPDGLAMGVLAVRFLLIGGAAYVILETFGIRPGALLIGLLTAVVAAFFEALFQLIYART